jgi:Zn-dependent peptidase ImmA (M78 family)
MNRGVPRDTMTIVHEIGHALLGHRGTLNRGPVGNRAERLSANIQRMEWQAKRYAAAFIMPDTPQVRGMSQRDVEKTFLVSEEAARIRKSELK